MLHPRRLAAAALTLLLLATAARASDLCPDGQPTEQLPPTDPTYCAKLDDAMRHPSRLPLDQYESVLNDFVGHYCHRRLADHWAMDKTVRDAGPFVATLSNGTWTGNEQATHMPVLIWYSPEMVDWLTKYRAAGHTAPKPPPIPDGAIMIKEMYNSTPAAACRVPDLMKLKPVEQGAAVMVRDSKAAKDGWFWGWYGWPDVNSGWHVDYPPPPSSPLPFMGFGQYCLNCHASAHDNQTFASPDNIKGQPGTYLSFLSQDFYQTQSFGIQAAPMGPALEAATASPHLRILAAARAPASTRLLTLQPSNPGFMAALNLSHLPALSHTEAENTLRMPPQTYDNVWVPGQGPRQAHAFITSDQCVGCHSAGGTGLQFEMTAPLVTTGQPSLYNFSPYGTWRTSPMGLAGRDPIFFTQLASETQTFHAPLSPTVQTTCLGCHGIQGERQFAIDTAKPGQACPDFLRDMVDAIPYPANTMQSHFGGLARDGISCESCHHMVLGKADTARYAAQPQNRCIEQRQQFLNPDNKGFARTFTGSFFIGDPDKLYGPFDKPQQTPMNHALGVVPEHSQTIKTSEICGTCHTVHLPVFSGTETIAHSYEQTTYPEWAFSAYRTGDTPDGKLPFGAGALAESCQGCHMPSADNGKNPFRSKIAGIQEHSTFPEAENALPATDIDLQVRTGFAKHSLVGLNVFFIEMAKQFNFTLGIPTLDPMLVNKAVPPLDLTEQTMLDQASNATASIAIENTSLSNTELSASVTVTNKTGHKFPSGVGFRRAFVDFTVSAAAGNVIWESGRTNSAGVLVDQNNQPIAGEFWWKNDCSGRINGPGNNPHQPHYQTISRQDQVQIFQELVTTPPSPKAQCGRHTDPTGELTTSFLSICGTLKDNRLLPAGFLPLDQRVQISHALGAGDDMAEDAGSVGTDDDPAYRTGGGDTFAYHIPLSGLSAPPAKIQATLYYQAIPPFFLQDRFCTAKGTDVNRLRFVTSQLKLDGTRAAGWKLNMVSTGPVAVP
jgi:cytochrome c553